MYLVITSFAGHGQSAKRTNKRDKEVIRTSPSISVVQTPNSAAAQLLAVPRAIVSSPSNLFFGFKKPWIKPVAFHSHWN